MKSSFSTYPFGSPMPSRSFSASSYKYGFNGKEKDDEVKGGGNSLDFGARIYDSRLGRWLAIDPLQEKYPFLSPYNFTGNNPILFVDYDGKDYGVAVNTKAKTITIRSVIYVAEGDNISATRAENVKSDFESQNGKFAYKTEGGEVYDVVFETSIQKVAEVVHSLGPNGENKNKVDVTAAGKANSDPIGNSLEILPSDLTYNKLGTSGDGDNIKVAADVSERKGRKITRHEKAHTLGVSHSVIGKHGASINKKVIGTILQNASNNSTTNKIDVKGIKDKNFISNDTQGGTNPNTNITTSDNSTVKLKGEIIKK
jgi:RHS repeat-associated protein